MTFLIILILANAMALAYLIFVARIPEAAAAGTSTSAYAVAQEEYEIPVNLPDKGPLLELTDEKVRLKVGDEFEYRKYIETAVDRNGKDLTYHVRISGDLNMKEDGRYTVIYSLTSQIDGETAEKECVLSIRIPQNRKGNSPFTDWEFLIFGKRHTADWPAA